MPNPICHFELMVPDTAKARAFYSRIFEWSFEPAGMDYALVHTGGEPGGGLTQTPECVPDRAGTRLYVLVDSIEETLSRVEEAGGKTVCPKTEIPGVGWFALFADPDGIVMGLFACR